MIYIKLKESVFDPVTGKAPFAGMSDARKVKSFYTVESSGSEIGIVPMSPPLNRNRITPQGQNSNRTLNISLNPIAIDEVLWAKSFMTNQGYLVNRLVSAIADGIIEIRQDSNPTPLTAAAFSTLIFGA